ncbi:MAG: AmmeMemoRadiSam system protein A [Mariprofundus sp.]|nr:AmmeMemoRadiSam system protein A [Mariprofundus sp.]
MNDPLGRGDTLIALARHAIAAQLGIAGYEGAAKETDLNGPEWLQETAATFVTLTMHGQLRGCIGSLEAYRPLVDDVQANAVAAAFHDPRFSPLSRDEFDDVRIEVSVLSAMQPVHAPDEDIALSNISRGVDGVVFKYGTHQATFLPQVWDQLPEPRLFMAHLKQKAGLPAGFWHPDVQLYKYQVSKYIEQGNSKAQKE